jgi:hypothetical protein
MSIIFFFLKKRDFILTLKIFSFILILFSKFKKIKKKKNKNFFKFFNKILMESQKSLGDQEKEMINLAVL